MLLASFISLIFQYEEICSQLAESLQVEDMCDVDQMITKVCLSTIHNTIPCSLG